MKIKEKTVSKLNFTIRVMPSGDEYDIEASGELLVCEMLDYFLYHTDSVDSGFLDCIEEFGFALVIKRENKELDMEKPLNEYGLKDSDILILVPYLGVG